MNAAAMLATLRLIGRELHARTCNDHNPLIRFARSPGGITGDAIAGWAPNAEEAHA